MAAKRLDEVLIGRGDVGDEIDAFIAVTEGRVLVNGQKAISPSQPVGEEDRIEVKPVREFVGRGAEKLNAALATFGIDVAGKTCADAGAATGGFSEVLLKRGARRVYAIDAGRGKLDPKLRADPRVVVMEGVNVLALGATSLSQHARSGQRRNFAQRRVQHPRPRSGDHAPAPRDGFETEVFPSAFGGKIELVTIDVSLTSLRRVLPVVRGWLADAGSIVALFKPQYEVEDKRLLRHGVLEDAGARERTLEDFRRWLAQSGWRELGFMESPIRGAEGNVEYLFHVVPA